MNRKQHLSSLEITVIPRKSAESWGSPKENLELIVV